MDGLCAVWLKMANMESAAGASGSRDQLDAVVIVFGHNGGPDS